MLCITRRLRGITYVRGCSRAAGATTLVAPCGRRRIAENVRGKAREVGVNCCRAQKIGRPSRVPKKAPEEEEEGQRVKQTGMHILARGCEAKRNKICASPSLHKPYSYYARMTHTSDLRDIFDEDRRKRVPRSRKGLRARVCVTGEFHPTFPIHGITRYMYKYRPSALSFCRRRSDKFPQP